MVFVVVVKEVFQIQLHNGISTCNLLQMKNQEKPFISLISLYNISLKSDLDITKMLWAWPAYVMYIGNPYLIFTLPQLHASHNVNRYKRNQNSALISSITIIHFKSINILFVS